MNKRVLNIGGNSKAIALPPHYNGWEHILLDLDPAGKPDIIADARDLFSLPRGSFDAIYCSHNLEHYLKHHVPLVISGFWHLIKEDGFVEIRVPDLAAVMQRAVQEKLDIEDVLYHTADGRPIMVHDVLYGYGAQMEESGMEFYAHRCGFTESSLLTSLYENGFEWVASCRQSLEVRAFAFKQRPSPRRLVEFNFDDLILSSKSSRHTLDKLAQRATTLWGSGQHAAAAAMAEIVFNSSQKTDELCLLLGEYALQQEDYAQAAKMFEEAVTMDTESLQGHLGLVRSLTLAGNKQKASRHLTALAKQDKELAALIKSLV